jgi:hypothetical protein
MSAEDLAAERDRLNALSERVIGAAIRVHKAIGPGVHVSAMRSYLGFLHRKLGLVINFNVKWLKDGITRVVNGFPE